MSGAFSGRRVLVVEDESVAAGQLEGVLTDMGCAVVGPAGGVSQALAMIDAQTVDAAVLDLNLSGQTSYPVADALAARGVPFIFVTGHPANGPTSSYERFHVLRKPLAPSDIVASLELLLARSGSGTDNSGEAPVPPSANDFQADIDSTPEQASSVRRIESMRQRGGFFVEAVRVTRMPMVVTDATLPGNPILFANDAFIALSGYTIDELVGQDPHFMNGDGTDPEAIRSYQAAIADGRDEHIEILQYRKDRTPFRVMLFASPLTDGRGAITNHFLSYLDISRRYDAEQQLRALTLELEERVALRTQELGAANSRLSSLVAEREMLLVEVNHRAKNSLAIAAALLSLQGQRQSDPTVGAMFEEARDRLTAMSRVHDMLSKSESSQRVDIATYVLDLCDALRPVAAHGDRIRIEALVDRDIFVGAETAVPLGIVLTELVTNAVKYAFPEARSGTIVVQAKHVRTGIAELTVRDDGIGVSAIREGSLGYGLVRSLVQQIKGDIAVRGEPGLTVQISFPYSRSRARRRRSIDSRG